MEEVSDLPDEIILTDVCCKLNKKISYIRTDSVVLIESSDIISWNFLQQFKSLIKDIFLPKGYPESVSSDYLEYQIWDTCQAFCSSISGTLAMRSVMQGIGVGSEAATPVSAAVTWLMKDGTGMVGSIMFAWLKGSNLDSDCKKWRLFADVLNDIAMFVELYIPYVMEYSVHVLYIATLLKALVGTAGSSTRAALVTHQAIRGNIADVSAKDGSQEIFTNLCAFIFGIFILKNVNEPNQIWSVMSTAILLHLIFNYKAVRCLKINVFNSERFCLSLRTYLPTSIVPTVEQINKRESVFLIKGISDAEICGFSIVFGASLRKTIESSQITTGLFSSIIDLFSDKRYFIMPNMKKRKLYVTFQQSFEESDVLKAYFHASLLGISINFLQNIKDLHVISRCRKNSPIYRLKNILQKPYKIELESSENRDTKFLLQAYLICEDFIDKEFAAFCKACNDEGWTISRHLINVEDWRAEWKRKEKPNLRLHRIERLVTNTHRLPRSQRPHNPNMKVLLIS